MPCESPVDGVIICRRTTVVERRIMHCPTCKRRRRFVVDVAVWDPSIATCCGCGDAWGGGERLERPFKRGWRKDAVAKAREKWTSAMTRAEVSRWFNEQIGKY